MSRVEEALRSQREVWREVADRVTRDGGLTGIGLSPEPPKRVLLFGVGSSHFAARLTGHALLRDRGNFRIPLAAVSSLAIGGEVRPAKGDWAFAFSHRGKTPATLRALETCAQAGAFTLLVAGEGVTESEHARYILNTCPMEKVEPHTVSVTSAICAVTSLLLGARVTEEWDALRSLGDPSLDQCQERAGRGPAAILGEWEGEWIAREAALKLMEMAQLPVRAFSTEEFFHGPRLSLKPEDKLWYIALRGDERANEVKSHFRVDSPGKTVLAWVPALMTMQWMALATSLNLGLDPDQVG